MNEKQIPRANMILYRLYSNLSYNLPYFALFLHHSTITGNRMIYFSTEDFRRIRRYSSNRQKTCTLHRHVIIF